MDAAFARCQRDDFLRDRRCHERRGSQTVLLSNISLLWLRYPLVALGNYLTYTPSQVKMCSAGKWGSIHPRNLVPHFETSPNEGMTMCISLVKKTDDSSEFILAGGYESGHTCVYSVSSTCWSTIYSSRAHSQPVLSLAIHPSQQCVFTSSADANLVQHPTVLATQPIKVVNSKHSGQTGLSIRDDGRILVTAGWDGCGRVYSATTLKQVAVLKWHVDGLQATCFSQNENGKRWLIMGGKDGKLTLWDVFN